jgi:endogenous inhibitor of DNA gyrase (YacG/DUF329 family)
MKSKSRKCSQCKKKVEAENTFGQGLRAFCSMECLMLFTKSEKGKQAIRKSIVKQDRKDRAEVKEKQKSRSQWLSEAQSAFNAYVRWRDRHEGCISCGRHVGNKYGGNYDCGHFRSRGSAPHLRFNLWNAHKQCVRCNRYLSGNVSEYRVSLIWKLGHEKVEYLECLQHGVEHDINYAKRVKSVFTRLLKHRKKMKGEM